MSIRHMTGLLLKSDKSLKREALALLRSSVHNKVIDQWGLLHVCLYIVRGTKAKTWTASFHACNMDPRTMVSFPEWCKKIAPILASGQTFKSENPVVVYSLLPGWWHGTLPEEKKAIVGVIDKHEGFTPQCCMELKSQCSIPFVDQQIVRVCYEMAKQHPKHLEMGIPSDDAICVAEDNADVRAAYEAAGHVHEWPRNFPTEATLQKGTRLVGSYACICFEGS